MLESNQSTVINLKENFKEILADSLLGAKRIKTDNHDKHFKDGMTLESIPEYMR